MISRYFYDNGYDVRHILHSQEVKSHAELEEEMIAGLLRKRQSKLREVDQMFGEYTAEQQRVDAYRLKNQEVGYKPGEEYENEI